MQTAVPNLRRLSEREQITTGTELVAKSFRESLYLTAKFLLGYGEISWPTHKDVFLALQAPTQRKLVVLPRGSFKSSICSSSYPVWLLLRNPNLRILIDSEVYSNSKNFLREIRGHLEREEVTSVFGKFKSDTWNEGELTIRQRTKVLKEASITVSGIGAEKTSQHYDVIIMDDLNSPSNSGTIEGRQKVLAHYRYNLAILEPGGTMVVVATRYAADDVPGHILATELG